MKKFNEKLSDYLSNVFAELILALLTPLILIAMGLSLLWGLIRYPFCNAKYKKSRFFKDFGMKHAAFVYDSDFYAVYNAVREADLPLTPILCRDRKGRVIDILFYHENTLLYINSHGTIDYDADSEKWTAEVFNDETDEDETVDFIGYVNKEIDDFLTAHPDCAVPDRRVILIQKKHIAPKDRTHAMETPAFLVYTKDRIAEAIGKLIAQN